MNGLISSIFTAPQITVITVACIVLGAVIALNMLFAFMWRVKAERKMHNDGLQERRAALLAKLEYLKAGGESEPQTWIDFAAFGDDEDADEEEPPEVPDVPAAATEDGKQPPNTVILAVDELSPSLRSKLGMRAKRFGGKKFYVRYALGFEARLRLSDDETKERFVEIMNTLRSYEGVTLEKNFSNRKIFCSGELLATVTFVGKRLCVAFALDPADYASGKYRADDKSDKKRFAKTPLVVRVLSDNKVEVAEHLFADLAEKHGLSASKRKSFAYDLTEVSKEKLIKTGAMRVVIVDEVSPNSPQYTDAPTDTISEVKPKSEKEDPVKSDKEEAKGQEDTEAETETVVKEQAAAAADERPEENESAEPETAEKE